MIVVGRHYVREEQDMDRYVVNNRPQETGEHEVHKEGCKWFPSSATDLGEHAQCSTAVEEAKKTREVLSHV